MELLLELLISNRESKPHKSCANTLLPEVVAFGKMVGGDKVGSGTGSNDRNRLTDGNNITEWLTVKA